MDKNTAIKLLKDKYPDLVVSAIVEDDDKFIAQLSRRDNRPIFDGVKAVYKDTEEIVNVNPMRTKGLVKRLMEAV